MTSAYQWDDDDDEDNVKRDVDGRQNAESDHIGHLSLVRVRWIAAVD